jgi:gluconolactonase
MLSFRSIAGFLLTFCLFIVIGTTAQAQKKSLVVTPNDPVGVPKLLAEGLGYVEGPSVDKDGNILTCDSLGKFIRKVTPYGEISAYIQVGSGSCGSAFDKDGNLYLCNYACHHILKVDMKTLEWKIAAERTPDGETLRGPNDLTWDNKGRLYFSDPSGSGIATIGNVCYIDLDGKCKKFATGFGYPNGVAFTKDYKFLYLADFYSEVIWKIEVNDDGTAGRRHFFYYMGQNKAADGIRTDAEDHLWIANCYDNELLRVSPEGKLVYTIKMPGVPGKSLTTNMCFGGPDMRTAFVTTHDQGDGKLYSIRMPAPGMPQVPDALKSK